MENVRILCEKMIDDNINGSIDSYVRELLTMAVMAIVLDNGEYAYEKLPTILQRLNIYAEDKSVLDIAHDELGNYSEDDELRDADASATRSLAIDEETNEVEEHLNFLISLTDVEKKDATKMIEKTINGLIHFMRYGKINVIDSAITIKDGICTINYNKNTNKLRRKHFTLEGGISQYYTLRALSKLYVFVEKDDSINSTLINKFKDEYLEYNPTSNFLSVSIIESLCEDSHFKELLDSSFEECNGPSEIATYYNNVLHDSMAFSLLSKQLDSCEKEISVGNEDRAISLIGNIKSDVARFKKESFTYKKK